MDTWGRFLCLFALVAALASAVTDKTLHRHAHRSSEGSQEKLFEEAFAFLDKKPKPLDPDAQQLLHTRRQTNQELAAQLKSELADGVEVNAPKRAAAKPVKVEPIHGVVNKREQHAKEFAARVKAELADDDDEVNVPKTAAAKPVKVEPMFKREQPAKELAARVKAVLGDDDDEVNVPKTAAAKPEKDESIHRVVLKRAKATKVVVPQASEAQVSGPVESPQQVAKLDDAADETRPVQSALPAAKKQPVEGKAAIPAHAPVHLAKESEEEEPPTEEQLTRGATEPEEPDQEIEKPELPFSELQPFGRRNVGESLTESSISQSNAMVDQLERAEVAEEKRAVFRSLTRLRGVALSSFDGVARSQTGNIEDYAEHHHWRSNHPVKHLAEEESDVKSWAFPANADFF